MHDLRFVEDNWESPTLGAWGLGWEVWLNGMEVTQFTYFQQAGGLECRPVTGEITYGLERLAMYLQNVDNVFDLVWTEAPHGVVTYGDVFHQNEVEQIDVQLRARQRRRAVALVRRLRRRGEETRRSWACRCRRTSRSCKACHTFNLLDARRAISVTERQRYILRVRTLARAVAEAYFAQREKLGFPGIEGEEGSGLMSTASESLLIEIGTEELPPKALDELAAAFAAGVCAGLASAASKRISRLRKPIARRVVSPCSFRTWRRCSRTQIERTAWTAP